MTRIQGPRLLVFGLVLALLAVPLVSLGAADQEAVNGTDGTPRIVTNANASNYLLPPTSERTRETYVEADVDVAGAVAVSAERLGGRHDRLTFDEQLDAVSSEREVALVTQRAQTLESRIAELRDAKRGLITGLRDETIGPETAVRRLAILSAAAEDEGRLIDRIDSSIGAAGNIPSLEIRRQLAGLRVGLVTLQGPVTERIVPAVRGGGSAFTFYLLAGDSSEVLATTENGTFRRAAYVGQEYRPGASSSIDITGALDRARELYPWSLADASSSVRGYGDTAVYRILATHSHGELRTFIDGATRNVFREIHTLRGERLPVSDSVNASDNGLALRVNTTAATGPMLVTVEETGTGLPADATVRVGGQVVGTTGGDGRLWTVQPRSAATVNATAAGSSVTVRAG